MGYVKDRSDRVPESLSLSLVNHNAINIQYQIRTGLWMQRETGKIVFRDISASKKSRNSELFCKDSQALNQTPQPHNISTKRKHSLETDIAASQSSLDQKRADHGICKGLVVKGPQQTDQDHESTQRNKIFEQSLTFQEDSQVMNLECVVGKSRLKFVDSRDESSCEISDISGNLECGFTSMKELQKYSQSHNTDSLAMYENPASKNVEVVKNLSHLNEIYKDISRLKQEKMNRRTMSNIEGIQHSLMQIEREILRVY